MTCSLRDTGLASRRIATFHRLATAIEFMREHVVKPVTMTDVATAVFVSMLGLNAVFTRERDETPMR